MCVRVAFVSDSNKICKGKGIEFTAKYIKSKEEYWNQFKIESGEEILLSTILEDLGYNVNSISVMNSNFFDQVKRGYWSAEIDDLIDFGMTFDEDGHFLLNFNCKLKEPTPKKKRCYYWKEYKYHVDLSQISLKGWIDWCNELYELQHDRPRPSDSRIFISPYMKEASVKARFWNKDKIEKWLNDHGYKWTMTEETKYQWKVTDPENTILINSDEELQKRRTA